MFQAINGFWDKFVALNLAQSFFLAHQQLEDQKECRLSIGDPRVRALELKRAFIARYNKQYPGAVQSLVEAGDPLFSYFDFPKSHWRSIKSTNVIESIFNAVKLRTDAARR